MEVVYSTSLRRVNQILTGIVAGLIFLGFSTQIAKHLHLLHPGIARFFDFDQKMNLPTAYKVLALLGCTVLLGFIAIQKKLEGDVYTNHWKFLSWSFGYLLLDEMTYLHQTLSGLLRDTFSTRGLLYFPWILVYLPVVIIFVLFYLRFFLQLPRKTQLLFLLAGIGFAGGSGGIEPIKAVIATRYTQESLQFALVADFSDTLECLGLLCFIRALMEYLTLFLKVRVVGLRTIQG